MDFNNIDWGYIMDMAIATLVGALIAVAGSILVNWFSNRKGYKDIDGKIGTLDNTTLSGQHNQISKSVDKTSQQLENIENEAHKLSDKIGVLNDTTLSGQNKTIMKQIDSINTFLNNEKSKREDKLYSLNGDMSRINSSIETLSSFAEIMRDLSAEKEHLILENQQLKSDKQKLLQENSELKARLEQTQTHKISFTQNM